MDNVEDCRQALQNEINAAIASWTKRAKDQGAKDFAISRQIDIVLERISKIIRSKVN